MPYYGQRWQVIRILTTIIDHLVVATSRASLTAEAKSAYLKNLDKARTAIVDWDVQLSTETLRNFIDKIQTEIENENLSRLEAEDLIESAKRSLEVLEVQ